MTKQEIEFAADQADKYSKLISRNALLEELRDHRSNVESDDHPLNIMYCIGIDNAINRIEMQPAVDAIPAVYGYWQEVTANELYGSGSYAVAGYVCSHCGFDIETADYETYNFCPCCGAIMSPDKTQI